MQVVLVMFRSDGERRSFSVVRNMTIIGRREDCDLRIPVGDVSRKHCRLVLTDDGIRIEDLGSSNGTFVNGDRVQESDLHAGDTVGIGPVQFIVQIDGVPHEDEMTAPTPPAVAPMDDEDSMIGHAVGNAMPAPPTPPAVELPELPVEEEFLIEDELSPQSSAADDVTVDELPPEELPADELGEEEFPLEDLPVEKVAEDEIPLEELPLSEPAAGELPLESIAEEPEMLDEVAGDELGLEEFPIEELPAGAHAAEAVASEEPMLPEPTVATPTSEVAPAPPIPIEELSEEEFNLEELSPEEFSPEELLPEELLPEAATLVESPKEEHSTSEISLEALRHEEPLEELDSLDDIEPEPLQAATGGIHDDLKVDELHPLGAADEPIEDVDLDSDETASPSADAANDSEWDFLVEETDGERAGHDFKIDLDSKHGQPHGQG
jgi:pSer/pThr/pTyr-binding forkhead associated (FHA) protein